MILTGLNFEVLRHLHLLDRVNDQARQHTRRSLLDKFIFVARLCFLQLLLHLGLGALVPTRRTFCRHDSLFISIKRWNELLAGEARAGLDHCRIVVTHLIAEVHLTGQFRIDSRSHHFGHRQRRLVDGVATAA